MPPTSEDLQDSIAIVGMACRFPGASDLDGFWRNLATGKDSLTEFSKEELLASGVDPRWVEHPDYVRRGMVLPDIEKFDAAFFGLTAHEAEVLDPQQRLLLECSWEALESAGHPPSQFRGPVGVYVGARISEYLLFNQPLPDLFGLGSRPPLENFQRLLANDKDYLATRIAYLLDLRGPALTVQTACSTSLVAVHLACQSLLNRECDMALAGGASVRVPQKAGYLYSAGMVFSPDGHTRPFDADAAGTIFGSGAGIVALRRAEDALADGDRIFAIIRGSAINNDGSTEKAGFTAPSPAGQARVVAEALAVAAIDPATISYVEAHGTATSLGDVIELTALNEVFGGSVPGLEARAIGSVKSNIGHLVQAAGVASLVKTALMLERKMLVPSLHYSAPNPRADLGSSSFRVNTEFRPWESSHSARRAGVSSFGFGGTNAHVVLEESPERVPSRRNSVAFPLLTLSARSPEALQSLAGRYVDRLKDDSTVSCEDVAWTSQVGRTHFAHRGAVLRGSIRSMRDSLSSFATGERTGGLVRGGHSASEPLRVAFLFTGPSFQYAGMARGLYEAYPVFRRSVEECDGLLRPYIDRRVTDILFGGEANHLLSRVDYSQAALVSLQVSLVNLWREWGVEPEVVIGQGLGELAAAWSAGVVSLQDALRLAATSGRLLETAATPGCMANVFADFDLFSELLDRHSRDVSVAAFNGTRRTVVSGHRGAMSNVLGELAARGVAFRSVNDHRAFRSPLLDPILDAWQDEASHAQFMSPQRRLISTLTGGVVDEREVTQTDYWRRQLREPIQFAKAMNTLSGEGCDVVLEIGPNPARHVLDRSCLKGQSAAWLSSLRRRRDPIRQMMGSVAELYVRGADIHWREVHGEGASERTIVDLPAYPFERKRHWTEADASTRAARDPRPAANETLAVGHPLLGVRQPSPLNAIQFQSEFDAETEPYLRDHWIFESRPVMMAAYLETVRAAAAEYWAAPDAVTVIENVIIQQPLLATSEAKSRMQTVLSPSDGDALDFSVFSAPPDSQGPWTLHVSGRVRQAKGSLAAETVDLAAIKARCEREVTGEGFYDIKRARGSTQGPALQAVTRAWLSEDELVAEVELPPGLEGRADAYRVHPTLLNAGFQCVENTGREALETAVPIRLLPTGIEAVTVHSVMPAHVWCHVQKHKVEGTLDLTADVRFFDDRGRVVLTIKQVYAKGAKPGSLERAPSSLGVEPHLHEIAWQKLEPAAKAIPVDVRGVWLLVGDQGGLATRLAAGIEARGGRCIVAGLGESEPAGQDGRVRGNPRDPAAFRSLVAAVKDQTTPGRRYRGTVYLGSLDMSASEVPSDRDEVIAGGATLHLVQALLADQSEPRGTDDERAALWLVTRGAQATGAETTGLAPSQAMTWGLGRVLLREQPDIRCRLVDLDPASAVDENVERLFGVLSKPGREEQVAFRGIDRYVPRLRRVASGARRPSATNDFSPQALAEKIREDGTYLITGGLGALGLQIAERLASYGARHLVLLGRRVPSGDAQALLDRLTEQGVTIRVMSTDITRLSDVERTIAEVSAAMPALRGIVHAAGVADDSIVPRLTYDRFLKVLAPKLHGAWNLHKASLELPLDFFVVISSVAALWGAPGRSSYASANAYLDQLAFSRRRNGLPALSLNYGSWAGGGMAGSSQEYEREQRVVHGQKFLRPEEGLQAFDWSLAADRTQTGVFNVDWSVFARQFSRDTIPMIFRDLVPTEKPAQAVAQAQAAPAARTARSFSASEITEVIVKHVSQMLGQAPRDIDVNEPLSDLGIDSLMSLLLRGKLTSEFGSAVELPVARFLDGSSIARLVASAVKTQAAAEPVAQVESVTTTISVSEVRPSLVSAAGAQFLEIVRPGGMQAPIVVIGDIGSLRHLIDGLPADIPVWWLKLEGVHVSEYGGRSVSELSAAYFADLLKASGPRPVVLLGFSYGGLLAYDLACLLQRAGWPVRMMLLEPSLPGSLRAASEGETNAEARDPILKRGLRRLRETPIRRWIPKLGERLATITKQSGPVVWLTRRYLGFRMLFGRATPERLRWWYYVPQMVRNAEKHTPWTRGRNVHVAGTVEWLERCGPAWRSLAEGPLIEHVLHEATDHLEVASNPSAVATWMEPILEWASRSPVDPAWTID